MRTFARLPTRTIPPSSSCSACAIRTDSALPVARALIRDRPRCDIELVIDSRAVGSNLKVANLENMLPAARHDWIVMADSHIRVTRDYLGVVTAPLPNPATGVVTCLYKGIPTGGLWSRLLALHINFAFLPSALLGEALGIGGGCFGATIALRRDVLERIGGFSRLRNELADDHRIGAAVRRLGLAIVLSPYLVDNYVAEPSLTSLWQHELRWARTVRLMAPAGFAGSAISHTVVLSVAGRPHLRGGHRRLGICLAIAVVAVDIGRGHRAPSRSAEKRAVAAAVAGCFVLCRVCG